MQATAGDYYRVVSLRTLNQPSPEETLTNVIKALQKSLKCMSNPFTYFYGRR